MATVTVRYGGDEVVHALTAVHISTTALDSNTSTGYDPNDYPSSPEVTYYLQAELAGQDDLRSQVAAPNGGKIYWEGVVFPVAGSWAVHCRKVSDDSSVANTTVSVV